MKQYLVQPPKIGLTPIYWSLLVAKVIAKLKIKELQVASQYKSFLTTTKTMK